MSRWPNARIVAPTDQENVPALEALLVRLEERLDALLELSNQVTARLEAIEDALFADEDTSSEHSRDL